MKKIVHICPLDRNTGDNALNKAIRTMLGDAFEFEHLELVGNSFDRETFDRMNAADAVMLGGGGVIHSCSGGNSRKNRDQTGTMWNMNLDWISELQSKIILYSVGFNRFQGEPGPLTKMGEFYDVLSHRDALVSFRNDLSRERFLQYFPRFQDVRVTPDPGLFCRGKLREGGQSYALLQIACDRLEYRYPNGLSDFIALLNEMREMSPVPIYLIPHTTADRRTYGKLVSELKVDNILGDVTRYVDVDDAMDLYRNALYTISTRGHSQICSIGNGTPTFAMSTHPKARGFMEDIGQLDACFDYLNGDRTTCLEQFGTFLKRLPKIRDQLIDSNRDFDAQISEFNNDIYRYVYEDWTPPPFLTAPNAVPELDAVRLEDEIAERKGGGPVAGETIRKDHSVAYLPGRSAKVGLGTYVEGTPQSAPKQTPALAKDTSLSAVLRRVQRSSDGATCGLVISCDANYFVGVATCVQAVRRYNPQLPITFLDSGLRPDQIEQVKQIVDAYVPIPDLDALDVRTFPSHLSKAALSSLYCHLAEYDKILYLDVDALVMGDLSPMFEALDTATDIVGIRGSYFNHLIDGRRHTTRAEIAAPGIPQLAAVFPTLDLDAPGINTGCFTVWSRVSRDWQPTVHELLPFLEYFRTADQALMNAMMSIMGLKLKLFDPMYNCMGFQLTKVRHQVQELTTGIDIDPEHCALTLAGRRIVVAHFAGRQKPWNTSLNVAPSFAWDWHAAETDAERQWVVSRHRLSEADCYDAIIATANTEMQHAEDPFDFCLRAGDFLRSIGQTIAADELFSQAALKRKKSFAAAKNQLLLGAQNGRFAEAVQKHQSEETFSKNQDQRLLSFGKTQVPAYNGKFSRDPAVNAPPDLSHLRVREYARINNLHMIEPLLSSLSLQRQLNPEMFMLRSYAATNDQAATCTATLAYLQENGRLKRRANNAALRNARARLAAVQDVLSRLDLTAKGPIGQLGAGFGHFLLGLGHMLDRKPVSLELGAPVEAAGLAHMPFEDCGKDLSLLVAANIQDRAQQSKSFIAGLGDFLQRDGYLLLVDAVNNTSGLDLYEGLGALAPRNRLLRVDQLSQNTGFTLVKSWYVNGERILLLRKLSGRRPSGSSVKAQEMLNWGADILRGARAALAQDPEDTAALLSQRLSRIVFRADTILGDVAPVNRRKRRVLPEAPIVPLKPEAIAAELSDPTVHAGAPTQPDEYLHTAYWSSQNAGDKVLCEQTAALFSQTFPEMKPVRRQLDAPEALSLHATGTPPSFIVLGGGGIIHSTSGVNGVCEWNITQDELEALDTPIVCFGIGLNEFRGSDFYQSEAFTTYMRSLVKKSVFVGVRERRSVEILRERVPEFAGRIAYQPCASLMLRANHPVLQLDRSALRAPRQHVVINPAFDRASLRFGHRMDQALVQLENLVNSQLDQGHRVSIFAHCPEDAYLHSILSRRNEVGIRDLSGLGTTATLREYNDVDLVIGMRTHAQLIPFAIGIPIISIATHDKLLWALDDLGFPSFGVELFDTEFLAKTASLSAAILADPVNARLMIKSQLNEVFSTTQSNLAWIKTRLQGV